AEDIFAPVIAADVAPRFTDDDCEFAFVIDAPVRVYRQYNRIGWPAQCGRRFQKKPLIAGPIGGAHFDAVVMIIHRISDDLVRPRDRSEQFYGPERNAWG